MNIFSLFKRSNSAPVARERLQILLAHERSIVGKPDLLAVLREEILEVVGRHVPIEPDKVRVRMERGDSVSTLEVDIEIPSPTRLRLAISA
jgi:cell division topological specificity factor